MNKRTMRSFSFGLILSVLLIGSVYYSQDHSKQPTFEIDDATSLLQEKGYTVLKNSEYSAMKEKTFVQNEATIQENKEDQSQENPEEKSTTDSIINYQLEVVSGMTSSEIANTLGQNQIVKDEAEFAHYLIKNGFQTEIQLGSYSLTNRMDFAQIAKMITKR